MEQFKHKTEEPGKSSNSDDPSDIVDNAIARMISGAVVKEERRDRTKFIMKFAVALVVLAVFLTLSFVYLEPASETQANGDIVITLKQDRSGHYLAKGKINDVSVKFLVDTGATQVVIPMAVAKKIGLPFGEVSKTITANGIGTAYDTAIKSIELGDIRLTAVKAQITEGLVTDEILLGMSFLRRTRMEQEKGVLKITY